MSPTESGTYKSGESYREWSQFEAALRRSLKFYLEERIANNILSEDYYGTEKTELITYRYEIQARVLEVYRNKDSVKKCFDDLKNNLDMKRLRNHYDLQDVLNEVKSVRSVSIQGSRK